MEVAGSVNGSVRGAHSACSGSLAAPTDLAAS